MKMQEICKSGKKTTNVCYISDVFLLAIHDSKFKKQ